MYPRLFHCHFHTCLSFSTLICGVERRSLLSCQQHSCNMTTPCCAIYTFPVNVSVCPSGLDPTAISSFCNMSHLLSSLLLMLPLIRQVVANPMFLSFFLRCFLVGFFLVFLVILSLVCSLMIPCHSSFQILPICSLHALLCL